MLGNYKIPREDIVIPGSAQGKGDGELGLQSEFADAVRKGMTAIKNKEHRDDDFAKTLGQLNNIKPSSAVGYMSADSIDGKVKSGAKAYSDSTFKLLLGWGLAWEIDPMPNAAYGLSSVNSVLSPYGVEIAQVKGGIWNRVIAAYYRPTSFSRWTDDEAYLYYYSGDAGDVYSALANGEGVVKSGESKSGSATAKSQASMSSVAYFFANQFNTFLETPESTMLQGQRALANDEPVYDKIKSFCQASMRSFSSGPSGEFLAWYPDYWGLDGSTPVKTITAIELMNLKITQSDKSFYSHVYCTGVDQGGNALKAYESQGVVSIESDISSKSTAAQLNEQGYAEASDEVSALLKRLVHIPEGDEWKYTPRELYRRYGARPLVTNSGSAKLIENRIQGDDGADPTYIMPFLTALNEFLKNWAEQNKVEIEITFDPTILPGCRIRVEVDDVRYVECYVKGVTHNMDYSGGFTTKLDCICPVGNLVSGMVDIKR